MDKKTNNNPIKALIFNILIGLGLIGAGIYFYLEIVKVEQEGGSIKLNRILWFMYDIAGAWGVLGFFIVVGLYLIVQGYFAYKKDTKDS